MTHPANQMRIAFDDHGSTGENYLEYVEGDASSSGDDEIVMWRGNRSTLLVRAMRDQWGVYYLFGDLAGEEIAAEDGMRPFMSALITLLRRMQERNEPPTEDPP